MNSLELFSIPLGGVSDQIFLSREFFTGFYHDVVTFNTNDDSVPSEMFRASTIVLGECIAISYQSD